MESSQTEIYSGAIKDEPVSTISWEEHEGILLRMNPSNALSAKYVATIVFTLSDISL